MTQNQRLQKEPLSHCPVPTNCKYPVCSCFDHDKISSNEADRLLIMEVEPMIERLRFFIDDLKAMLKHTCYYSREQLLIYRRRKIRLQKNLNFWLAKYKAIRK